MSRAAFPASRSTFPRVALDIVPDLEHWPGAGVAEPQDGARRTGRFVTFYRVNGSGRTRFLVSATRCTTASGTTFSVRSWTTLGWRSLELARMTRRPVQQLIIDPDGDAGVSPGSLHGPWRQLGGSDAHRFLLAGVLDEHLWTILRAEPLRICLL